jgi:hypothetical protein
MIDAHNTVTIFHNAINIAGTRDALYGLPLAFPNTQPNIDMILREGTSIVVIGVQHVDTIGAAYNSMGISVSSANGTTLSTQWVTDSKMHG